MTEPNLFDTTAKSRSTDPDTSRAAALNLDMSGKHAAQLVATLRLVQKYPGRTATELAAIQDDLDRYQLSRRLPELRDLGKITNGITRPCRISVGTRSMQTWEPV